MPNLHKKGVQMPAPKSNKIEIENVLHPGKTYQVDAEKFNAMKLAFLHILPSKSPGLTAEEIGQKILPKLNENLFPQGATAGWWKNRNRQPKPARGFPGQQSAG